MSNEAKWALTVAGASERELAATSELLTLIGSGRAATRAELARSTGWAASTVTKRIDTLLAAELVLVHGSARATGGRPAARLQLNPDTGVLLSVDIAPTVWRVAAADFTGTIHATATATTDPAHRPEDVLPFVLRALERLVAQLGSESGDVRGIALALPCPVDHAAGRILRPPLMPGWGGFDVHAAFAQVFAAPLLLDNDVNLMALGEHSVRGGQDEHLLFVNLGYGIGSGIVSRGMLHRGGDGAAGDIGHLPVPGHDDARCSCGKTGCVEAIASGRAIAAALRRRDPQLGTLASVLRAVTAGDERARGAVTLAAGRLGEVLAGIVSFYNPTAIVVGGELAQLEAEVFAAVRDAVYRRALPLATRTVTIARGAAGDRAAVIGGAVMLHQHLLSPVGLEGLLTARRTSLQPDRRAAVQ